MMMKCMKCGLEMKKVNLFGLPGVDITLSQGVPNWQGMEVRSAARCFVCPGCGYVELQAAEPYKFK